jgi:hypothetical protein
MIDYNFLGIVLLSLLDNTLTHYQFFVLKLKGYYNPKLERNPIARFIIAGNPGPFSLIKLFIFAYSVLYIIFRLAPVDIFYQGAVFGLFFAVNMYHSMNIHVYKLNWNNKKYWSLLNIRKL